MDKRYLQVALLLIVAALVLFALKRKQPLTQQVTDFQSCQQAGGTITDGEPVTCTFESQVFKEDTSIEPEVVVDQPQYGTLVSSPLKISGKARGNWFFEAQMPAVLKDEHGKILAQGPMHATADWMTTDFVPFTGNFVFNPGNAQYGVLVISKDNPSGDPAKDASFAVPVGFK